MFNDDDEEEEDDPGAGGLREDGKLPRFGIYFQDSEILTSRVDRCCCCCDHPCAVGYIVELLIVLFFYSSSIYVSREKINTSPEDKITGFVEWTGMMTSRLSKYF